MRRHCCQEQTRDAERAPPRMRRLTPPLTSRAPRLTRGTGAIILPLSPLGVPLVGRPGPLESRLGGFSFPFTGQRFCISTGGGLAGRVEETPLAIVPPQVAHQWCIELRAGWSRLFVAAGGGASRGHRAPKRHGLTPTPWSWPPAPHGIPRAPDGIRWAPGGSVPPRRQAGTSPRAGARGSIAPKAVGPAGA